MSIYNKEKPSSLERCLQSLLDQSLRADEVVLVKDGSLTLDLDNIISAWENKINLRVFSLEENMGLGYALNYGLLKCENALVARMDTDDIAATSRFEKQVNFLNIHNDVSIVGTWITEFNNEEDEIYSYRKLPVKYFEIFEFSKKRNPLNHMTVMFRKSDVIKVGSYLPMLYFEDYYLWCRMLQHGFKIANIPLFLVNARAGKLMLKRRSGFRYFKYEFSFQKKLLDISFISRGRFIRNIIIRFTARLIPELFLSIVYKLVRKSN